MKLYILSFVVVEILCSVLIIFPINLQVRFDFYIEVSCPTLILAVK